jgi:bifunctional UDP-N-acetylglucosamine pyrophosphorylase/glucosamine-1-phosphate N-acetyltransferase
MLNIVILAAGQGKRMKSERPKVLHPIAGRPMIHHLLDTVETLAPARCVMVLGHGAEQVGSALPEGLSERLRLAQVRQEPQLGTGHAVMQALPKLLDGPDSRTLILLGDCPLIRGVTLQRLLQAAGMDFGLLTLQAADPTGLGRIVRNEQGEVTGIVEHRDASDAQRAIREVNTGIMVVPTAALQRWLADLRNDNAQGEYYLTDIVAMAVAQGMPVHTTQPAYAWEAQGVNSRAQLASLERAWQAAQAEALMEAGVTLADPARLDVRGRLTCGRDVMIDVNVVFEGTVVLGDRVQIGPHVVLRDCVIEADARIEAFSHLQGCKVGRHAQVGPYARLRPGSDLAEHSHIGNFVEVKNSRIGRGSKANHLSYVGDASVGERVNIGAGTITCNYDGANKHRTVIEDDAFIGSDTQLVAPVTVGAGATIGAGTTLTKDAPAGQLTVSRPRQTTIPGWRRPSKPQG